MTEAETMTDLERQCRAIAEQLETGVYDFDPAYSDYEEPCAGDYLSDALEIETVKSREYYKGSIILVAFGGPNIWIDTRWREVRGAWWGDRCTIPYRNDALGLDDWLEEIADL